MSALSVCFSSSSLFRPLRPLRVRGRPSACAVSSPQPEEKQKDCGVGSSEPLSAGSSTPFFSVLPSRLPSTQTPKPVPLYRTLPVVGILIDNWLGISPAARAEKYGGIYRMIFVTEQMNIVTNMDAIREMHKNPDLFSSRDTFDSAKAVFGENSMLLTDGVDHAMLRNTVAPAFSPTVFPFFFEKILERAKKTWAAVEDRVEKSGKDLLDPAFRKHYLSVVVEMTTGIDMDSKMASTVSTAFFKLTNAFYTPPFGPIWDGAMKARVELIATLEGLIRKSIIEKKETIDKLREYGDELSFKSARDIGKGDVNAMLIAIATTDLETGVEPVDRAEALKTLADLMLLLWFAGYSTSAATTSCAAFEMGMDAKIWTSLVAEQDALVQAAGSREVAFEQVSASMPILDSFITEVLRLHPAVQGVIRVATEDVNVLGYHVKAGEKLLLDYIAAMRDPRKYPDPNTLHMDRFMRREGQPQPTKVISFGTPGSPHYCLGAALARILMRTTLAVLLREYDMVLDPNQSKKYTLLPEDTPKSRVVVHGLSKRKDGLWN